MPSWLTELLKARGVATPFIYAAAIYGFFVWLDKKASGQAKKAISSWLVPSEYDRAAVQAAILEMFDRVYTRPLFTWRAFGRSAAITITATTLLISDTIIGTLMIYLHLTVDVNFTLMQLLILVFVIMANVTSDYISLFVVKYVLSSGRISPFRALIIGPALGLTFVLFFIFIRLFVSHIAVSLIFFATGLGRELSWWLPIRTYLSYSITEPYIFASAAALLVHMWLPLFALCVGLLKGLNYFLLAAKKAQWFLKRGNDHPLEAIGL
jgi:hypothetical protein